MVRLCRWFLILLVLIFNTGRLFAANAEEERVFGVALDKFHGNFFEFADKDFGAFIQKYTNSIRLPEAVLYQGQARYFSGQFAGAIEVLSKNQNHTNKLADQYLY